MDPLDFLDSAPEGATADAQPAAEAPPQNATPTEAAPPAAPEPPAPPEPQPPHQPEPGFVPFAAVLDERDKRKAAEARIAEFERAQAARQPEVSPPDPYEDPQGYDQYVRQQVASSHWQAVTSVSQVMANKEFGADLVNQATEAFMAEASRRPSLIEELRAQAHPYEWVVNRHKRETAFAKLDPSEVDQYLAWKAGQAQAPTGAPAQPLTPPAAPAAPRPPVSLASAPAAGGSKPGAVPVGPGEAFNSLFGA